MKQQLRLFPDPAPCDNAVTKAPSSRPVKYKRDARAFDRDNREAARIILSDPKYRGVMQEWAEMVMERIK